jgi:hypothetical protein
MHCHVSCHLAAGLRWSQRESYCQYIPDSAQWPAVDPTQQYVDFTCVFPISQCYITLIVQVRVHTVSRGAWEGGGHKWMLSPLNSTLHTI